MPLFSNPVCTAKDLTNIYNAAQLYEANLCNRAVYLFYPNESGCIDFEKVVFQPQNFAHLVGCLPSYKYRVNASDFYKKALHQHLSYQEDFVFSHQNQGRFYFEVKIEAVHKVFKLPKIPLQIGLYDSRAFVNLSADKTVGHSPACLAIEFGNDYFYPKSVINRDIRECVSPGSLFPVVATACSDATAEAPKLELTYRSKKLFPQHDQAVFDLADHLEVVEGGGAEQVNQQREGSTSSQDLKIDPSQYTPSDNDIPHLSNPDLSL